MFRNIIRKYLSIKYNQADVEYTMTDILCQIDPNVNIDDLILYKSIESENYDDDAVILFTDSNSELFALSFDRLDFFHVRKMLFNDTDLILTLKNDNIEYILYPFDQCREVPVSSFYDEKDLVSLKVIENDDSVSIKWIDDMYLHIDNDTYSISKYDKIISTFIDNEAYFQLGDGCTNAYLYGTDLIVENCGDVSSLVIIKYFNMTKSANKM